jgi:transposase
MSYLDKVIEGINNKIKTLRQGYGYPDDEYSFSRS